MFTPTPGGLYGIRTGHLKQTRPGSVLLTLKSLQRHSDYSQLELQIWVNSSWL